MTEIGTYGPITCEVDGEPLLSYTSGVLEDATFTSFNHVISVVGWGEEETTAGTVKYWCV